ncbi:hypothetical protein GCM10009830_19840 [Glycomyces endophyticus]|uniref:Uncharacterized protein n=1 Tax=Glycomyces endophyticus TaxID=480996 RepID=A0ABP4SK78_9ACTN
MPDTAAQAQEDPDPADPSLLQSDAEALETDLALIAEAHGWTVAQARAQHVAAEAVEDAAWAVYERAPDTFVGTVLSLTPGGTPSLLLKGPADDWTTSLAASGAVPIDIVDKQPYSFTELQSLNDRLIDSLTALGYKQISSGEDVLAGTVVAEVQAEPGLRSSSAEIEALLPPDVAAGVDLAVTDALASGFDHAYGGARVRNGASNKCTSGWTVVAPGGTTGVTTAGHCDGIDGILEDGVGAWALTHRQEHIGRYGDVEWKTSTHAEPAKFYPSAGTLRTTREVELLVEMSLNESVCLYGRSSNDRDCGSLIKSRAHSCTIDGVGVRNLIRTNRDIGIGGDSGGGWSYASTAYGGHTGWCTVNGATRDVFSAADLFSSAIGVRVRTA